jgi:dTDP-4-dehydrorhamnose reductase
MIDTIIIFGTTGMLGNYVYRYFIRNYSNIRIIKGEFRIDKNSLCTLQKYIESNNISNNTCIINCIGAIPQRNPSDYWIVNSVFPQLLSNICMNLNIQMIQPSTDCVFNGMKGMYIETDIHDENNEYGISKSLGEPINCTVIRTSIIGKEILNKKSFLEWVYTNNANVDGWTNHLWNGITCLQWCKIIDIIIQKNIFWKGVRHIFSPKSYSKYEIICIIKNIYNLSGNIKPVESEYKIDKTLSTIYEINELFNIPDLIIQIEELKKFECNL